MSRAAIQEPRLRTLREDASPSEINRALAEYARDVNVRLQTSLRGEFRTIEVTGAEADVDVAVSFQSPPVAVLVCSVANLTTPDTPGSLSSLAWTARAGGVRILNFPGLASGERYRVTLLVLAG